MITTVANNGYTKSGVSRFLLGCAVNLFLSVDTDVVLKPRSRHSRKPLFAILKDDRAKN